MSADVQMACAIEEATKAIKALRPDCLLILGDRFEVAAIALAAIVLRLPIIHIGGGFETEGAFDNSLRHAITKMSSLHFVSNSENAARVIQLGENPKDVHVVGSAGIDNFRREELKQFRARIVDYRESKNTNPFDK